MNFWMSKLDLEKAEEPEIKLPKFLGLWRKQRSSRKTSTSALLTMPKPWTVWITTKAVENSERDGNTRPPDLPPEKSICNQEATVRTRYETTNWFQIGKGVRQGCILSPYLFNLYAEYIMGNVRLNESQAGIKIAGRNINNL